MEEHDARHTYDDTVDTGDLEARLKELDLAEAAIDRAYATGKAERAAITQAAQLDAAEAVAMAGVAMESDVVADEASRIRVIAEASGARDRVKAARTRERAARRQAKRDHVEATKAAKRAYDAIRFSAPNKLGFMRVIQVLFALHILSTLLMLVFTSRDTIQYNTSTISDWIMIALEGVAFWFFINRYKIARPFTIGVALFGIVSTIIIDLIAGTFNWLVAITQCSFYIFLIVYFVFSERVKTSLVNDLAKHDGLYDKDAFAIRRRGWPFVRNLGIYFVVFSVLGHWMEAGMCQFIILGWVQGEYDPTDTVLWRDWLYPFPMEGMAVVIIALFLYPLKEWFADKFKNPVAPYALSFLANSLMCTIMEFTMGMIMNSDLQMWDYSDNFCNIIGQVCLQNTLAFGVAASIITWFVYPMLERAIARVPEDIMNIVFVVVAIFGGILWSLYIIEPPEEAALQLGENAAAAGLAVPRNAQAVG